VPARANFELTDPLADVLYIWLFAMLGVNAFVIVLALAHATNERPDA
jgi:hypothetical protein